MTLDAELDALSPGGDLDITGLTYNGTGSGENISISVQGITLTNGTLRGTVAANAFDGQVVLINAEDVTIDGLNVDGGARVFHIPGDYTEATGAHKDGTTLRNTVIDQNLHKGVPLQAYGPINDTLIEYNDWTTGDLAVQTSMFSLRVSEGNPCSGGAQGLNNIVRYNYFDQGAPYHSTTNDPGWFGLELKCASFWRIHDNEFHGGHVHVSMPDCEDYEVDHNDFYMEEYSHPDGERPWLGVEIAGSETHNANVHHNNIVAGFGGSGWLAQGNSLGTTGRYTFPRFQIECNVINAGTAGNLTDASIKNNTITTGSISGAGNTGNVTSNNDSDGAQHADCAEGTVLTPSPASLTLTTFAPSVTATTSQVAHPAAVNSRGNWFIGV